jgi:hypothetical protein
LTTTEILAAANVSEEAKAIFTPDLGPSKFVRLLESDNLFKDAVQFLAHGLPIEIAVKWACACSRELLSPDRLERAKESLDSVEAWLKTPDDNNRWSARGAADKSGLSSPVDLIAMAVFFSGASITPPDTPATPPPPYLANKMVGGAIQLAVLSQKPEQAVERYRTSLRISRELVKPGRKS